MNYENPLYFWAEVKFGPTSGKARNLIFFANPNRIKMWTRLGG